MEPSLPGTFVPRNFRSQEFGTFAPWNFRSLELSFLGAKVPRTFAPWYCRSLELSLPGAKFQELSLPRQVTFMMGLSDRERISMICSAVLMQSVTDGQTDGIAVAYTH